jgi:Tol biopolymer transport system component
MVNRIMQLFEFDLGTKQHRQLTFSPTNKDDCSWSPCGNIIAYSEEDKGRGRLAMLNLLTKEHYYLTPEGENYSYPSWSPAYSMPPVLS